jgi:DNA-binding NarL/FixJ family response regulator
MPEEDLRVVSVQNFTAPSGVTAIDVAIIDDHMVVQDGVRAMAEREPDMRFVGGATSAQEAVALVEQTHPTVLLLDVRLGAASGLDLCEQLSTRFPDSRILVFSAFCNNELLTQAIRAGAGGYVVKDADTSRLPGVIREFHRTGKYFDPQVAGDLLVGIVGGGSRRPVDPGLSARERRIIQLVAQGASNHDIANELNISYHTVKFHISGLLRRFGVQRRAELVRVAMERQIVQ